jgi:hypothetical protein
MSACKSPTHQTNIQTRPTTCNSSKFHLTASNFLCNILDLVIIEKR